MKIIRTIITFLFFIAVIGLVGIFIFFQFQGKQFIEQSLSRQLNRPVTVSGVRFVFPIGLRIDDLVVAGVMKADAVRAIVGADLIFRREPVLAHVVVRRPVFALMNTKDTGLSICLASEMVAPQEAAPSPEASPSINKVKTFSAVRRPTFYIDELIVENGQVEYFDRTKEKPIEIVLKNVQLKARDIAYPVGSVKTKFNITAVVQGNDMPLSGSSVDAKGWIDLPKRDMQATLDVIEPGGRVGLSSVLEAVDNDLTIRGKVNLSGTLGSKQDKPQGAEGSLDQMLIGALGNSGVNFTANFSVKTKLDNIQIDAVAFGGEVGIGSTGSLKENFKNIGKQFEAIGKKLTEPETAPESVPESVPEPVSVNAVTH